MQFPLHSNIMDLIVPRMNRRNPHEIHWRREAPEWYGSIEKSHAHLYSHIAEDICCMQCGAIPCPYDHEEHKRLKLADLEFVKELAKERRELKERLAQLRIFLTNMEEKQLELKGEKMMLVEQIRTYERMQKEWERQKLLMEGEINRLKNTNTENLKKLQNYKKDQERLRVLTKRVQDLEKENGSLKDENQKYRQMIVKQSDEIHNLENKNQDLIKQQEESQVRIQRLRIQLDEQSEELTNIRQSLVDNQARVEELETSMEQLTRELTQRTKEFKERDLANQTKIKDLQNEIARLTFLLQSSEGENKELHIQINILLQELEKLRSKLSSDTRFRRFVHIKRECNDLKEQNEVLKYRVFEQDQVAPPVPFMKRSGRIVSAGPRRSPPTPRKSVPSAGNRPMLNRPKSAITLRSLDNSEDES